MFNGYGPAPFSVTINDRRGNVKDHQIQIAPTDTPGTFTMSVCKDGNPLHPVATLTIDEIGNILTSRFIDKFSDRSWNSISGSFAIAPAGGAISAEDNPTGTSGVWAAGGGGEQFPKSAHA